MPTSSQPADKCPIPDLMLYLALGMITLEVVRLGSGGLTMQMLMQMGGSEGVRAAEQYTLVVGLANGMMMHAVPRHADDYSFAQMTGHAHTNGHAHINGHA